jgi:hypothetical protein
MPVFDQLETVMVKKLHFTPSILLRLVTRSVYVGEVQSCSFSENASTSGWFFT